MKRRQRGMSLVVAIFLIVIIAGLAASAVSVGNATSESSNELLLADRARAAAEAGLEWEAYRVMVQARPCQPAGNPLLPLNQGALSGFRVTVSCQRAINVNVFDITAVAQRGNFGDADYAYRAVTRRFN